MPPASPRFIPIPATRAPRLGPRVLLLCAAAGALSPAPAAQADVVVTRQGLTLEGRVERLAQGALRVTTAEGVVLLAPADVVRVSPGDGPRAQYEAKRTAAAPADAQAWFRLALEAEALGLVSEARVAHERVLALEPEHAASRRALGHERVGERWLDAAEARRQRGLVLFSGEWRLPEEVEAAQRAGTAIAPPRPGDDDAQLRSLLRASVGSDRALSVAAERALAGASTRELVAAALALLGDTDPVVRAACCRRLGEWGDESALRALVFHGARDVDAAVRREAVLAAQSFGHDDVAIPFVRALGSSSVQLVANAAQALALLGDQRAAGYLVKRLESHGSSARSYVSFLNQVSYVRDYDVEIAQASNIANPNIGLILEGVVLDVQVKGASYTETWVEPYLVDALSKLAGERFGSAAQARAWYAAQRERLPEFPSKPSPRAPRRAEGSIVGAR